MGKVGRKWGLVEEEVDAEGKGGSFVGNLLDLWEGESGWWARNDRLAIFLMSFYAISLL